MTVSLGVCVKPMIIGTIVFLSYITFYEEPRKSLTGEGGPGDQMLRVQCQGYTGQVLAYELNALAASRKSLIHWTNPILMVTLPGPIFSI